MRGRLVLHLIVILFILLLLNSDLIKILEKNIIICFGEKPAYLLNLLSHPSLQQFVQQHAGIGCLVGIQQM